MYLKVTLIGGYLGRDIPGHVSRYLGRYLFIIGALFSIFRIEFETFWLSPFVGIDQTDRTDSPTPDEFLHDPTDVAFLVTGFMSLESSKSS